MKMVLQSETVAAPNCRKYLFQHICCFKLLLFILQLSHCFPSTGPSYKRKGDFFCHLVFTGSNSLVKLEYSSNTHTQTHLGYNNTKYNEIEDRWQFAKVETHDRRFREQKILHVDMWHFHS